ncbi:MAG: urease accessory protein UreD [Pseudomonadota bacterium]|nr:urease accessory protein UreD [Pseudomonadota bacterium]
MNAIATPVQAGWSASLSLEFERRGARTALVRNRHDGPLRVQRPFYPETQGQAHVYILHPPGGIVAGDSLTIDTAVGTAAHALVTTPSAGRVYCSNRQRLLQTQQVAMTVASGGFGEWLPQENIVFNDARAINRTRIHLQADARFIGWEITCLGRPASAELFVAGSLQQHFEVTLENSPILLEKSRFDGGGALLAERWGLNGRPALATMVCTLQDQAAEQALRDLCEQHRNDKLEIEVTQLPQLLILRAQAGQAEPIKKAFFAAWHLLRRTMLQAEAVAPRIWFT